MTSFSFPIPDIDKFQLQIFTNDNLLTAIKYEKKKANQKLSFLINMETAVLQADLTLEVCQQLQEYFKSAQFKFNLPLHFCSATKFQKKVWNRLLNIPVGKTITYGELAAEVKSGARAVANACRQNRFPIIIPCHRVVSKNGLGGYDGDDKLTNSDSKLCIKLALLNHEGASL
ncbi:MAG: MGMT family protein [Gammaproteobacteria bacterium]|nr:MGMT family protein [Gammaproteobacteria bacterium]